MKPQMDVDDVCYQNEWVVSEPADQSESADRSESADQSGQMCRCIMGQLRGCKLLNQQTKSCKFMWALF